MGTPWRGFGGLFTLAVIVSPMAVLQEPLPAVLSGDSLVPLGVVCALVVAVFRAGQQMQKLTAKLEGLDKLEVRLGQIEHHLGLAKEADG